MKLSAIALGVAAAVPSVNAAVQGFDISNWQSSVDFAGAYGSGARFVMIKVSCLPHYPFTYPFLPKHGCPVLTRSQ